MPVVSQAQRRWAFATAEGKTDAPPSVGREFLSASHGLKNLPEHVRGKDGAHRHKRGSRHGGLQGEPGVAQKAHRRILLKRARQRDMGSR